MNYRTYNNLQSDLDNFLNQYEELWVYTPPEKPIQSRIPQKDRTCRFCKKQYPDVEFKHDPHIIPQLLGRNFGVSDYECDDCNNLFSRYENALADYLGLVRTFYAAGKSTIPTFKSPQDSIIARMAETNGDKNGITISNLNHNRFQVDIETGINTITYTKNSYIPVNVYKSILKIALTLIPASQIYSYNMMFDFISNDTNDIAYVQFAKVFSYTTNHRIDNPLCCLFQKKDRNLPRPTHLFKLYFENFVYEIFIPYYTNDLALYDTGELSITYCPPFLPDGISTSATCDADFIDFTSTQKKIGEVGKIIYKVNPEYYKNNYMTDPKTGEKTTFKPEEISKISIFRIDIKQD
ncbi:hypothetical protein ABIE26_003991 [Pedobacter africanus]|uniref:Uncharacterized protein n=1 Tax=Pedobacter africanus TaxID=151894 RepID=A0ACC6L1B6_9SPHI|nr:HNH endonuclease [Pedobacter africanus]MDR6785292.1 hypothetical protein [Pedobacter africanus]